MKTLFILGRQPAIGYAELESLFGSDTITKISEEVAGLNIEAEKVDFNRLGGSVKMAEIIANIPIDKLKPYISKELLNYFPDSKFSFGISYFGISLKTNDISKLAASLKDIASKKGFKIRYVPNKGLTLNSAQVIHNKLTSKKGFELILVENTDHILIAKTLKVQDIFAYAKRDQQRPYRDAKIGMLPPKLAQIIINIATTGAEKGTILDPFCGTGVILQEALLMGYETVGSDLNPRMIEYSKKNIEWLIQRQKLQTKHPLIEIKDATNDIFSPHVDFVASETYLGEAYFVLPPRKVLDENIKNTDDIFRSFLQNVHKQIPNHTRLCLAVPAWTSKSGFEHLPTLDHLKDLGYNRIAFKFANQSDLIYYRPGQIVGRELVTVVKE